MYTTEFYNRYAHLVYGVCLKQLDKKEDAKDCIPLIFEKFFRTARKQDIYAPKNLLFVISKNESYSFWLKRERKRKQEKNWKHHESNADHFTENDGFQRLYNEEIVKEPEELIRKVINFLPEKQKECIQLFYYHKMTYKQIADEKNIPIGIVKSNLQNAKRNLRNMLNEKHPRMMKPD